MKTIKHIRVIVTLFCLLLITENISAQFYYEEDCKGPTGIFTLVPGSGITNNAYYTSGKDGDPVNNGWLRLTKATTWQNGWALAGGTFPSNIGVTVEFDFKVWKNIGGITADGFSVFLFDGRISDTDFRLGRNGGCLGYLPLRSENTRGLKNAYLGVALDDLGNFLVHSAQNQGQTPPKNINNQITLAGPAIEEPVSGPPTGSAGYNGYNIIKSITTTTPVTGPNARPGFALFHPTATNTRPTDAQFYRRVKIEVIPRANNAIGADVVVYMIIAQGGDYIEILRGTINQAAYPTLRVGFAGITGAAYANHEVRNVIIRTPGETQAFREYKSSCLSSENDEFTFTSTFVNSTFNILNAHSVKDILPPHFTPTNISVSGTAIGLNNTPTSILPNGQKVYEYKINLGANSRTIVTWKGKFNRLPTNNTISSTIEMDVPAWDNNPNDNKQTLPYSINRIIPTMPTNTNVVYADHNSAIIHVKKGSTQTLNVTSTQPMSSYMWQEADDNHADTSKWRTISGASGTSYTTPAFPTAGRTKYYRCTAYPCEHIVTFKMIVLPEVISSIPKNIQWGYSQYTEALKRISES